MADKRTERLSELVEQLRVPARSKQPLSERDPGFEPGWLRLQDADEHLRRSAERLAEYQERLAAEDRRALLVVLQGIDASGKDSTIRHVMSGVNPQGVSVHAFKEPSAEELSHDYLWRYQRELPGRGQIGVFNRSHYEEVLVVRVHPELLEAEHLPPESRGEGIWQRRYGEINEWERYLDVNGVRIVKLFLHISKEEQRKRFLRRIDRPEKNWKFAASDVRERAYWNDYQRAFSQMLSHTSTSWAPWYVIPADHKWFARLAVSAVIVDVLAELDLQYPQVDDAVRRELLAARAQLEAEANGSGDDVDRRADADVRGQPEVA